MGPLLSKETITKTRALIETATSRVDSKQVLAVEALVPLAQHLNTTTLTLPKVGHLRSVIDSAAYAALEGALFTYFSFINYYCPKTKHSAADKKAFTAVMRNLCFHLVRVRKLCETPENLFVSPQTIPTGIQAQYAKVVELLEPVTKEISSDTDIGPGQPFRFALTKQAINAVSRFSKALVDATETVKPMGHPALARMVTLGGALRAGITLNGFNERILTSLTDEQVAFIARARHECIRHLMINAIDLVEKAPYVGLHPTMRAIEA